MRCTHGSRIFIQYWDWGSRERLLGPGVFPDSSSVLDNFQFVRVVKFLELRDHRQARWSAGVREREQVFFKSAARLAPSPTETFPVFLGFGLFWFFKSREQIPCDLRQLGDSCFTTISADALGSSTVKHQYWQDMS